MDLITILVFIKSVVIKRASVKLTVGERRVEYIVIGEVWRKMFGNEIGADI